MHDSEIVTSVIIPIRNEERYIQQCLESLLLQDYPVNLMEVFLIDGSSTDKTCDIIRLYCAAHPHFHLLSNPDKTAPYALNKGIAASSGRYIIRMDAHSVYAHNYISQCVNGLERTGADNVGGVAETRGLGLWGSSIAFLLSSRFGVGNSSFRVGAKDGYVDTVPFGAFRREVFENIGCYDVRLTRNQDNELNYRIRKNGGKIYLSNDVQFTYFCRDSITKLAQNGFVSGKWNIITSFLCPGTMGLRHYIPLVFVLSLLFLGLASLLTSLISLPTQALWFYLLLAEISCYGLLTISFAASLAVRNGIKYFFPLLILYPLFHISYGMGSLVGLFSKRNLPKNSEQHA